MSFALIRTTIRDSGTGALHVDAIEKNTWDFTVVLLSPTLQIYCSLTVWKFAIGEHSTQRKKYAAVSKLAMIFESL